MPSSTSTSVTAEIHKYSSLTGLIFVFNLIVGTGALTLPGAFSRAGWALGLSFIIMLAFISFMTVTFIIESMSIANAVLIRQRRGGRDKEPDETSSDSRLLQSSTSRRGRERDPLIPPRFADSLDDIRYEGSSCVTIFEINQRVEMGKMASLFFGRCGLYLFYLCLAVYLYGDLAIYISAVSKSLRDVSCVYVPPENGTSGNGTAPLTDDTFCWAEGDGVTRFGAYRLFAILFLVTLGPFCFFNVSKTKYLQLLTSGMRWTAFLVMIGVATSRIVSGEGTGHPPPARLSSLPNLFGICVYSFMCHHSLPSIVTPIEQKGRIYSLLTADYFLITIFYLLLALTGIFAFDSINDLYTLNFEPNHSGGGDETWLTLVVQYFLALFPVFTLSTNFPIIAITLRNNLKSLFQIVDEEDEVPITELDEDSEDESGMLGYPSLTSVPSSRPSRTSIRTTSAPTTICCQLISRAGFPLLAILPPFVVAIFVEDLEFLVGVTGSYAGAGIQYFVPIFLVFHARRQLGSCSLLNPYASPFRHNAWLWFVLLWSIVSISFVTIHRFLDTSLPS